MTNYYFDPEVQATISKSLLRVHGDENKDDARQCAYEALCVESPINSTDACACVYKAVERFRNKLRSISRNETGLEADLIPDTRYQDYDYNRIPNFGQDFGSDAISMAPSKVDRELFLNTEVCPERGPSYYKSQMAYSKTMLGPHEADLEERKFQDSKKDLRAKLDSGYYVTMCRKPPKIQK